MLNPLKKIMFYADVAKLLPEEAASHLNVLHELGQKLTALTTETIERDPSQDNTAYAKELAAVLFAIWQLSIKPLTTVLGADELHKHIEQANICACGEDHSKEPPSATGAQISKNLLIVEGRIGGDIVASGIAVKQEGADIGVVTAGVSSDMRAALDKAFPGETPTITVREMGPEESMDDLAQILGKEMLKSLKGKLGEKILERLNKSPLQFSNDEDFLGSMGISGGAGSPKTGQA